jgi:hypothetical protein
MELTDFRMSGAGDFRGSTGAEIEKQLDGHRIQYRMMQ